MEGSVVDIAAETVADVKSIQPICLVDLSEVFLFVADVMFSTSNDPRALDALDGLGELYPSQDRIRAIFRSVLTTCMMRVLAHLKPSQFRPPSGDLPRGPATGPN